MQRDVVWISWLRGFGASLLPRDDRVLHDVIHAALVLRVHVALGGEALGRVRVCWLYVVTFGLSRNIGCLTRDALCYD